MSHRRFRPAASRTACLILSGLVSVCGLLAAKPSDPHLLGPTGMMGLCGRDQIKVTAVAKGSPADGRIQVGEVILGAGGKAFAGDVRKELAAAIDAAEGKEAGGKLALQLKDGRTVDLPLKVYGSYSATAPYDCPKTEALVTAVADRLVASGSLAKADRLAFGWLGLMATGEEKHLELVKRELPKQEWVRPDREKMMALLRSELDMGYVGWYWGYQLLALCEYHLLTGDASVLPGIESYALALSMGQDVAGTWGHRMATRGLGGRLPGYSHINQPSLACFIGLLLAQRCGVDDPVVATAVGKCHRFFSTFTGKGTIPYGVHEPKTGEFNNNGMSAMAAIAMSLQKDRVGAEFFSRQAAASHDRLETGHATHIFNVLWTPLGTALCGPEVTQGFFDESRWLYTSYRSWDDRFTLDGDGFKAADPSGILLLAYCLPRQKLFITGKQADPSYRVSGEAAREVVGQSRIDYARLGEQELIALFDHPAPQVKRRAVWELRTRKGDFIPTLVTMLRSGNTAQRISALEFFGYECPAEWALPQKPLLAALMLDPKENLEVRVKAAASLAVIGEQAQVHYEDMLKFLLEDKPDAEFGIFDADIGNSLKTLCPDPIRAGVVKDRDLLYHAALKLADNPRQNTRGVAMVLLQSMPLADFHKVGDKIKQVVLNRDPSYHSYHNPQASVLEGARLLAALGIREGLEWAVEGIRAPDGKGSFEQRAMMGVLSAYGANAKPVVEEIQADPERLKAFSGGKNKRAWDLLVQQIQSSKQAAAAMIGFEEAKRLRGE